jgi:hypothetical protein
MAKAVGSTIDYLVGGLIVLVLIGALASSIYAPLGSVTGVGNSTLNPGVPSWLPTVAIILVSVGLLYMIMKAVGVGKKDD